jgi:hypothetical protein
MDRDAAPRLAKILDELDVPLLDLGDPFTRASADDPTALIVRSDGHWNAAGHALAAEEVQRAILALGLLDRKRAGAKPP